ncbi:MAG: o-succinylbenzoate synthase [Candidatus Didemnitutus sp.]|nr:o-succinylbenzoate synthase [Candidatus Didemnitutus sp.]
MRYRFSFKSYRRALRLPLRTAHGAWTEREGIFVRLEREDGQVGFGEIAPLSWFGTETLAEAGEICRKLGDEVTDELLDGIETRFGCVRFALAAARAPNLAPASPERRLPVAALLPAGRAALQVLPDKLAAGYLGLKWKVGVERAEDELVLLDDLLAMLPAYVRLRLDANGAWDRRTAERWLAACAERPVEFVEQPAAADDDDLLLGLAEDFPVTLALDESVTGLSAAREWQERGWRGVFVLKPALAGPLDEMTTWITTTKPDVVFSSAIETALGRAQVLRAIFSADLTQRALGFGVGDVFGDWQWDGPPLGPLLDATWGDGVNPEALWNAVN